MTSAAAFPKMPKKKRLVYLDNAAATPASEAVLAAIKPWQTTGYGNPSSMHRLGQEAGDAVAEARKTVAACLATTPDTLTFTSGGTEANNLAILGLAKAYSRQGRHIITSATEHTSVLQPLEYLHERGFKITKLKVNPCGQIALSDLLKTLRKDTILISLQYGNNEIGAVHRLADIGRELLRRRKLERQARPYFHADACQAAGYLDLSVERLHVDLMTINSGKIYGPKASGALYCRRGVKLEPIMYGGGQEKGLRSGTENVAGIVGLAKALELAVSAREATCSRLSKLRDYFWTSIAKLVPDVALNGPPFAAEANARDRAALTRLPGNLNVSFKGVEGEALVLYLDAYGIMAATGSACASERAEPSHVLSACGLTTAQINGSVRFTLGKQTSKEDIDYALRYLPGIVAGLRAAGRIK